MKSSFGTYDNFPHALSECGEWVTQVRGVSMYPMLRFRRDPVLIHPVEGELKRYDVAAFDRGNDYVIHRIIEVRPDCYVFRGDNCIGKEIVPKSLVAGVVVGFWRIPRRGGKGRFISVENPVYRFYSRMWVALNPLNVRLIALVNRFRAKRGD